MTLLADSTVASAFPILGREGLVYLDSGATSQKPQVVIDALEGLLARHNANIHRGVYPLAVEATELYEGARERIAAFVGSTPTETIVTKNATEAINLVAHAWGRTNVGAGDAIVLTQMEHHSNIVPWHLLAEATGAELRWLEVDEQGLLDLEHSRIVSLVVETGCSYFESVTYPEQIDIGLRADRIGTSSVTYALGVFRKGAQETAAVGRFVHVTVDRETRRPVPLPEALRLALRELTA